MCHTTWQGGAEEFLVGQPATRAEGVQPSQPGHGQGRQEGQAGLHPPRSAETGRGKKIGRCEESRNPWAGDPLSHSSLSQNQGLDQQQQLRLVQLQDQLRVSMVGKSNTEAKNPLASSINFDPRDDQRRASQCQPHHFQLCHQFKHCWIVCGEAPLDLC